MPNVATALQDMGATVKLLQVELSSTSTTIESRIGSLEVKVENMSTQLDTALAILKTLSVAHDCISTPQIFSIASVDGDADCDVRCQSGDKESPEENLEYEEVTSTQGDEHEEVTRALFAHDAPALESPKPQTEDEVIDLTEDATLPSDYEQKAHASSESEGELADMQSDAQKRRIKNDVQELVKVLSDGHAISMEELDTLSGYMKYAKPSLIASRKEYWSGKSVERVVQEVRYWQEIKVDTLKAIELKDPRSRSDIFFALAAERLQPWTGKPHVRSLE